MTFQNLVGLDRSIMAPHLAGPSFQQSLINPAWNWFWDRDILVANYYSLPFGNTVRELVTGAVSGAETSGVFTDLGACGPGLTGSDETGVTLGINGNNDNPGDKMTLPYTLWGLYHNKNGFPDFWWQDGAWNDGVSGGYNGNNLSFSGTGSLQIGNAAGTSSSGRRSMTLWSGVASAVEDVVAFVVVVRAISSSTSDYDVYRNILAGPNKGWMNKTVPSSFSGSGSSIVNNGGGRHGGYVSSSGNTIAGVMYLSGSHNRAWSEEEAHQFLLDPWGPFRVQAPILLGKSPAVSGAVSVTPGVGAVSITGQAPDLNIPFSVTPGIGAVAVTGQAPTIQLPRNLLPGVGAVAVTGHTPTVTIDASVVLLPGVGAVSVVGLVPTVEANQSVNTAPGTGAIRMVGFAPTLSGIRIWTPQDGEDGAWSDVTKETGTWTNVTRKTGNWTDS